LLPCYHNHIGSPFSSNTIVPFPTFQYSFQSLMTRVLLPLLPQPEQYPACILAFPELVISRPGWNCFFNARIRHTPPVMAVNGVPAFQVALTALLFFLALSSHSLLLCRSSNTCTADRSPSSRCRAATPSTNILQRASAPHHQPSQPQSSTSTS
jgi:hypothetical protein